MKLDALGDAIDQGSRWRTMSVLTMGGEPTFVSIDDFQSAEWNTATAVGPDQAQDGRRTGATSCASVARQRLAAFRSGQVVSRRKSAALDFRALLAQGRSAGLARCDADRNRNPVRAQHRPAAGGQFCRRSGRTPRHSTPAICVAGLRRSGVLDALKEGELPTNVDPGDPEARRSGSARALMRVFERGLTTPAGFVLPIQRWNAQAPPAGDGAAKKWPLRAARLFLVPGDSRLVLRLPLDSLPLDSAFRDFLSSMRRIPSGAGDPACRRMTQWLQPYGDHERSRRAGEEARPNRRPDPDQFATTGAVRTALTIEPRDGILCVFMPPTETLEDYLELLARHRTDRAPHRQRGAYRRLSAAERSAPQRHQGDARSRRHRSQRASGGELARGGRYHHLALREEARQSRLGAEEFMIDGRHVGTGGGNHVVLGGAIPTDSPFLRRPDLLRSLVPLLAAASGAVLSVLRSVHRADQSGTAHRRSAA